MGRAVRPPRVGPASKGNGWAGAASNGQEERGGELKEGENGPEMLGPVRTVATDRCPGHSQ